MLLPLRYGLPAYVCTADTAPAQPVPAGSQLYSSQNAQRFGPNGERFSENGHRFLLPTADTALATAHP